jgi:hydrogenase/urease accessory protein HupE
MRRLWIVALSALLSLLATGIQAHEVRPGFLELRETVPGDFSVTWKVPARGAYRLAIQPEYPSFCRVIGEPVTTLVDDAFLERAKLRCEKELGGAEIAIRGLSATQTDVLVRIATADGDVLTGRILPARPVFALPARPSSFSVLETYVSLGVEHILLGVDHLLFVLGLILLVRDLRTLLWTVTAFTLAHSITLAAATLGWVNVPSAPVEAAIALSIVFLASKLVRPASSRSDFAHRFPWVIAFGFGLLHGLGFAGALAEVGLPRGEIPLALFAFNLGVELGQVTFIAAVVALGALARLLPASVSARAPRAAAYAIGCVAAYWTVERFVAGMA